MAKVFLAGGKDKVIRGRAGDLSPAARAGRGRRGDCGSAAGIGNIAIARFVFICLDELGTLAEELREEGFAVYLLNRRPGIDWRCSLRLATLLRRERVTACTHINTRHFSTRSSHISCTRVLRCCSPNMEDSSRTFHARKQILANRRLLRRRDRLVAVGRAVGQP